MSVVSANQGNKYVFWISSVFTIFLLEEKMKKLFVVFAVCMLFVPLFAAEENADTQACDYARKANDVKVWEAYLRKFPKGTCTFIAETELEKNGIKLPESDGKKASDPIVIPCARGCTDPATGYIWSSLAPNQISKFDEANKYCSNLDEGGFSDWRLPPANVLMNIMTANKGNNKIAGDSGWFWCAEGFPINFYSYQDEKTGKIHIQRHPHTPESGYIRCVRW